MDDLLLFYRGGQLDVGLESTTRAMAEHLQSWDPDSLLAAPIDDVIDELVDMGSVQCPALLVDQAWMPEPIEVTQEFAQFGDRYE